MNPRCEHRLCNILRVVHPLFVAVSLAASAATGRPPNIVLILTDDQRFDTIHELGNEMIQTPYLDGLVERGTVFTRAYMMGGQFAGTCVPSRAMLLSGRSLYQLGWTPTEVNARGFHKRIPSAHTTIPEALRNAGYTTFICGKWHNDLASLQRMFAAGSRIYGFSPDDRRTHYLLGTQELRDGVLLPDSRVYGRGAGGAEIPLIITAERMTAWKKERPESFEARFLHSSEVFGNGAVEFLRNHRDDRPFFLYLPFHGPHDPRTAPKRFRDLYTPDKIPLPVSYLPEHPFDLGIRDVRDEKLAGYPRSPTEIRGHLADYYAMITQVDEQIGRVLATLRETRQLENTIVVMTGDSGLAVGNHGLMGKQNLYDAGGVHVPLIFSGPGIPRGQRRDALVYTFDLLPTLCELAGAAIPATASGLSLVPVMKGRRESVRDSLYLAYSGTQRAVQEDRLKLIESIYGGARRSQLFDLRRDPHEMHDLAASPDFQSELLRLRGELLRLKAQYHESDAEAPEFWNRVRSGE